MFVRMLMLARMQTLMMMMTTTMMMMTMTTMMIFFSLQPYTLQAALVTVLTSGFQPRDSGAPITVSSLISVQ